VHTLEIGGRELELFLTKHTLAAATTFTAAALASVWCCYYSYCYWVRTSPAAASIDTEQVTEPHWRQPVPPNKPWRRTVARASDGVNVEQSQARQNVERSLSTPKGKTVTERAKKIERSRRHIMRVSSSWTWHLNRRSNSCMIDQIACAWNLWFILLVWNSFTG
jgi:hypothetical protein